MILVASAASAIEPIRVGVSGPFTGGSSPMGIAMRDGIRLAAQEINDEGGIFGRPLQLVERDDEARPERGALVVQELINREKVVAGLGIVNTGVALASQRYYQQARIPMITSVATGSVITKQFLPPQYADNYIFRVSAPDTVQAAMIIEEAVVRRHFHKLAILHDNTNYGPEVRAIALYQIGLIYMCRYNDDRDDNKALNYFYQVHNEFPATLAAQGLGASTMPHRDIVPPIHMASTFERAEDGSLPGGRIYARDASPAYDPAEALLCELEGGAAAALFASGMAAASAVLLALKPGARIVAPHDMYWSLRNWMIGFAANWQIGLDFYADAAELATLLQRPADLGKAFGQARQARAIAEHVDDRDVLDVPALAEHVHADDGADRGGIE